MEMQKNLEQGPVEASAPCRIDMGGTLDLSTFYLPLHHLGPCTFNLALDLRTHIKLFPYEKGHLKITSHGFESVVVASDSAPFNASLGLMLAVAAYFQADGVHVQIESTSPPRSALGGSSVAAVALIWAFAKLKARSGSPMPRRSTVAILAHAIEQSVAGVPCGLQDQLAAVYGGVNAWHWKVAPAKLPFERQEVVPATGCGALAQHLLVAYCGRPHVSKDVNAAWVAQFVAGRHRRVWHQIVDCSRRFVAALAAGAYADALAAMNQETDLRCRLTPDVLDAVGLQLVAAAREHLCGARFTGAGAGGCIWSLGTPGQIAQLRPVWEAVLAQRPAAKILPVEIDTRGVL
jgi:D-glycero-alpha-D-manno-heptose-7-phosphate kinase